MKNKPKITVLTVTCRPGYIDTMVESLKNQIFKDFEWILVDELFEIRKKAVEEYVDGSLSLLHIPPKKISETSSVPSAINTGLEKAQGELVYFMNDYIYLHPNTLNAHWDIYKKYGPKIMISGPLIDKLVLSGTSIWYGAGVPTVEYSTNKGKISYSELMPPVEWPMKKHFRKPNSYNLISIWEKPFKPNWPIFRCAPDWRIGYICNEVVDYKKRIYACSSSKWWWAGRNDSADLSLLKSVGGMDEKLDGLQGIDSDLASRMAKEKAHYLVDKTAPCFILPHPSSKNLYMKK